MFKIGMDAEFMAYSKGRVVFPKLSSPEDPIRRSGCDEFGHCVEIRPEETSDKETLIANIATAIGKLPQQYKYFTENIHIVKKEEYYKLIRSSGSTKELPVCKNIYGSDILDDSDIEGQERKQGNRVLYCGMHIHVSTFLEKVVPVESDGKTIHGRTKVPLDINKQSLTALFDTFLYEPLREDKNFASGKFRMPGYYEEKSDSHFEYRSLGSSALTPVRVAIIFQVISEILNNYDSLMVESLTAKGKAWESILRISERLRKTKESHADLKKVWTPWNCIG